MFTTTYRPNKLEDFIGNKEIILPFIRWLLEWDSNNMKNKCALISGICGIGKSLLVDVILKKHDYNIINLGLDDNRDKNYMLDVIKPLIRTKKTFNDQENVLVVSEVDNGSDNGFISSLVDCIKESKIPIVCICDNRFEQSIKPILNYCFDIKMTKPKYQEVYKLLYNVVMNEKPKDEPVLKLKVKIFYHKSMFYILNICF